MIQFDANSIYDRLLTKLQQDPNWKAIANNSVISAILNSNAEVGAEIARYAEYLFKESKWDAAQNPSSILAMANMLGYQPARKISATGEITVSLDPRIHLIGKTIFPDKLDEADPENKKYFAKNTWTRPSGNLSISSSANIIDSKGNNYIAIPATWSSDKYFLNLKVIQGQRRVVSLDIDTIRDISTHSELDPYLTIPVVINDCENAGNPLSKSFFKVFLVKTGESSNGPRREEYRVVDTLLLSTAEDKDVEVHNDLYSQDLFYLKFNNDPVRGGTLDLSRSSSLKAIEVEYIKSAGSKGNLNTRFEKFLITTGEENFKLFGINKDPITGGADAETAVDIKLKAPKYYIRNYTAGTKEAYKNTILNLTIKPPVKEGKPSVSPVPLIPSKVNVYAGVNESKRTVTYVSFIAPGLDDFLESHYDDAKEILGDALNISLQNLKSPQDTIEFEAPEYISLAVGVKVKVDKDNAIDLKNLENKVREFIDSKWGPVSPDLDFRRNFSTVELQNDIKEEFQDIIGFTAKVDLEATNKLNWLTAQSIETSTPVTDAITMQNSKEPVKYEEAENTEKLGKLHTIRLGYDFSNIFLGTESFKGFRDARTGTPYTLRVDLMYKKPVGMSTSNEYSTSIFVEDSVERYLQNPPVNGFFRLVSKNDVFHRSDFERVPGSNQAKNSAYNSLLNAYEVKESYQYYLDKVKKVMNDTDYAELKRSNIASISDHIQSGGAIDDYLIYYNADYTSNNDIIVHGWLEFSFDSLYKTLSDFSIYDVSLRNELKACQLSQLKCGLNNKDIFERFKTLLSRYVDIYVSLKPCSDEVNINSKKGTAENNKVLFIDSSDGIASEMTSTGSLVKNLTADKMQRMISVDCTYKD